VFRAARVQGEVIVPHRPEVAVDHVIMGLLSGGLAGVGQRIQIRELERVVFSREQSFAVDTPDSGELQLKRIDEGTKVVFELLCGSMLRRRILTSVLLGAVLAAIASLALDGQLLWTFSIPLVGAVLYGWLGWRADRSALGQNIRAYLHNLRYLKLV
jgi:hypothetical protein